MEPNMFSWTNTKTPNMTAEMALTWMLFLQTLYVPEISANGGCKNMVFKVKLQGKALRNHVFQTTYSGSQDFCRILCYLDNRCLSYNYGTGADGHKDMCELSESDHIMHGDDLTDRPDTVYLRAENNCKCQKNQTCRYNFVDDSHYCVCKTNSSIQCNNGGGSTASPSEATTGSPGGSPTESPSASTGSPSASTGFPGASTESPGASTGSPDASTGSPGASTESPGASTGSPDASTESPSPSTGSPSPSTGSPSPSTESPGASTGYPGASTGYPGASTESPSPSTGSPVISTTGSSSASTTGTTENPTTIVTTQAQTTTASSSESDCDLQFASASTSNYIRIRGAFPTTLQAFTVSFWLKAPSSSITLYPFSYATSSVTSALSMAIKDNAEIEIGLNGGGKTINSFLVRNNNWQHFVVTWKSSTGNVKLYYNGGTKTSSESGLAEDETFPTGGTLIIGQYQGGFEGNFDHTKTMKGSIVDLNVWSSEYTASQASTLFSQGCGVALGDVLSWTDILKGEIIGTLPKTCPATCKKS